MSVLSPTAVRRPPIAAPWPHASGLLAHQAFVRLWAGQSVSLAGSEITTIALLLTAALMLGTGPAHMGLLAAAARPRSCWSDSWPASGSTAWRVDRCWSPPS